MSDIRDHIASQMFGIPVSQITDRERQLARDEIDKGVKEYLKDQGGSHLIVGFLSLLIVGFLIVGCLIVLLGSLLGKVII